MSEGEPQTTSVEHVRSQSGDDPFSAHDTLRSFGKKCRRRIRPIRVDHASEPIDHVSAQPTIGLKRPAPRHDMVRRPQACLFIDEPALEHPLHWHRRTSDNTDFARVKGVRAKQTALCIAATRDHWNARLQTQVSSRIFAERPKCGARRDYLRK